MNTAEARPPSLQTAPLAGIEVLVVDDDHEHPVARCLSSLRAQRRAPARVQVLPSGGASPDEVATGPGAPWVLVLRSGDRLSPDALLELERRTDSCREPVLLVRIVRRGRAATPAGAEQPTVSQRLLVRRDWSGWTPLVEELAGGALAPVAARLQAVGRPSLEIGDDLVAPLGELHTPPVDFSRVGAELREPGRDLTLVAMGGLPPSWPATLPFVPTLVAADWLDVVRMASAVRTGWMCALHPAVADRVDGAFLSRVALRRRSGATALVLTPLGDEPLPDWQRLHPVVGTRLDVVALACAPSDVLDAARDTPAGDADALVQRIVERASINGRPGASVHGVRIATGVERPVEGQDQNPVPTATMRFDPIDAAGGPVAARIAGAPSWEAATVPTWAARHVVPLELVVDPTRPGSPALATELAPLRAGATLASVVIGGIERHPFPGSQPLLRWTTVAAGADGVAAHGHGSVADAAAAGAADAVVLGYAPQIPLVDMSSLHRRWELGVRELERSLGVRMPEWPPTGVHGYAVNRLPSRLEDRDPPREYPTVLIDTPVGPLVARHPDTLAAARSVGLCARQGPALATEATFSALEIELLGGRRGFARAVPGRGDAALEHPGLATCWGTAPPGDRVPLVEWRSDGQQRLTTGDLPLVVRRGRFVPDTTAVLIGTLGWLAPLGSGEQPLYELFHPGRGQWAYSSQPDADDVHGYRVATVVAETVKIRSMRGVGLRRWYDRASGQLQVGYVAPAGSIALYGWLDLVDLGACGAPPTVLEATVPRPCRGGWPVVVVHRAGVDTVTADPGPLLRAGGAVTGLVGFLPAEVDEVAQLEAALAVRSAALGGGGGRSGLRRAAHRVRREVGGRLFGRRVR